MTYEYPPATEAHLAAIDDVLRPRLDPWRIGHVGIVGLARTGKDTIAGHLCLAGWVRVAFADSLRSMALAVNPWVHADDAGGWVHLDDLVAWVGWDQAKEHDDVRVFLQRLGTDGVRDHLGDTVWVDLAMRKATVPTVFPDCRFPNEADAIRARGGTILRVVRPDAAPVAAHVSEAGQHAIEADWQITNDGTVADLHAEVDALFARLGWP